MDIFKIMSVISCVTSTMTMIAVFVAMLPHVKSGMVVVRDAVLWAALVLLLFGGVWKIASRPDTKTGTAVKSSLMEPLNFAADRYYAGKR